MIQGNIVYGLHEIPGNRLNQAYIDTHIPTININRFLFVAYSHGLHHSLVHGGTYYIKTNVNSHLFANSFFYSMCCLSALELGIDITNNHSGVVFIGYNDNADALLGAYMQLSIDCDNHGLKEFLSGKTAEASYQSMKDNFTQQIDILESIGEILRAASLRRNRDALVFYGNPNLIISDFDI